LAAVSCSRCHQLVDSQAITCPHCRLTLKAHGHPGIPLHRAIGEKYLCEACVYNLDDSCNFPKRPYAQECTLYQNLEEIKLEKQQMNSLRSFGVNVKTWFKRHLAWLLILFVIFVCLLIAVSSS
jgi:Double zinc ribbon